MEKTSQEQKTQARGMIGVDTNVLARYLLADDAIQSAAARRAIHEIRARGDALTICVPVFLELEWVLRSRREYEKEDVIEAMRQLLDANGLVIDGRDSIEEAIHIFEHANVDFAECLFHALYLRGGATAMLSFDKQAQKHLPDCIAP
jgi:predicted nucleic-acid-binding protein